jgi:MFS family permease
MSLVSGQPKGITVSMRIDEYSGYITIASARNIQSIAAGIVVYAVFVLSLFVSHFTHPVHSFFFVRSIVDIRKYSRLTKTPASHCSDRGLQLLTQIIIADLTSLKWRGLVSGLMTAPFILNAFIGSNIVAAVIHHAGWRWGCL